jgi:hypothetical protein
MNPLQFVLWLRGRPMQGMGLDSEHEKRKRSMGFLNIRIAAAIEELTSGEYVRTGHN